MLTYHLVLSLMLFVVPFNDMRDAISTLKNSPSKDCYGVNVQIIKTLKNLLVYPLTHLFNACILQNCYPDCLKISTVIPIHKRNDTQECNNYRPISLTPIISKLFEKILKKQLYLHFENNNLFNDSQFGFRQGRSTDDAISELINQILRHFELCHHTVATFYDLTKAFDCVNHDILIKKFQSYNFSESSILLLSSYLSDRLQHVKFMNTLTLFALRRLT